MGVEIERKFLVRRELWPGTTTATLFRQGYLTRARGRTTRVRRAGERAFLTIKGESVGLVRPEFEYEIPVVDVDALLLLCEPPLIEKWRHLVPVAGHTWEVDEFLGANAGLFVAEIELTRPDETFVRPEWAGDEVTDDPRYLNSNLSEHPYSSWRRADAES